MSTMKSLEFLNNPKVLPQHQQTPDMLLPVRPTLSRLTVQIITHTHRHTLDPGVRGRPGEGRPAVQCSGQRSPVRFPVEEEDVYPEVILPLTSVLHLKFQSGCLLF